MMSINQKVHTAIMYYVYSQFTHSTKRSSKLTAISNSNSLRSATRTTSVRFNSLDNIQTVGHFTKHSVLSVQPRSSDSANEKLGSVGVWTGVCHTQDTRAGVFESEVFITEFLAVDAFTASAIATSEVTTLEHKVRDDAVEGRSLEVEGLARAADTLLTCIGK